MAKIITPLFLLFFTLMSASQEKLSYFLPDNVAYDEKIPTPEVYFGMQMGEWHLTHDQVRFIPLCARCVEKIEAMGRATEAADAKDVVVVI